jgi:twin BRCT domain
MGTSISDLELRKRLVRHGARVVTNFGKRGVTHVILGPNKLAGGKIQNEMLARKVGVKYVTVDWYELRCLQLNIGHWTVCGRVKEWSKRNTVQYSTRLSSQSVGLI